MSGKEKDLLVIQKEGLVRRARAELRRTMQHSGLVLTLHQGPCRGTNVCRCHSMPFVFVLTFALKSPTEPVQTFLEDES